MFLTLLAILSQSESASGPALGAVSATVQDGGTCPADGSRIPITNAVVRVSWSITNADDTLYENRVYENDVLKATVANTTMHWDKTLSQEVHGGSVNPATSNWTYRVDVRKKSDGSVVARRTSDPFKETFGQCPVAPV